MNSPAVTVSVTVTASLEEWQQSPKDEEDNPDGGTPDGSQAPDKSHTNGCGCASGTAANPIGLVPFLLLGGVAFLRRRRLPVA